MKADNSLKVISASGLNIAFWAFNVTKPPLDKSRCGRRWRMAIDRDAIIKDVYLGAGEKAKTLIPRTMWSYDDAISGRPLRPGEGRGDA